MEFKSIQDLAIQFGDSLTSAVDVTSTGVTFLPVERKHFGAATPTKCIDLTTDDDGGVFTIEWWDTADRGKCLGVLETKDTTMVTSFLTHLLY